VGTRREIDHRPAIAWPLLQSPGAGDWDLSGDGSRAAYVEHHRVIRLRLYDVSTGTSVRDLHVGTNGPEASDITRDGRLVAFGDTEARGLHVVSLHESTSRRLSTPPVVAVRWSPDASAIAYATQDPDSGGVWMVRLDSGERRCLAAEPVTPELYWSPSGEVVYRPRDLPDTNYRVVDVATGAKRMLLARTSGTVFQLAFSPDGRRVVAAGNRPLGTPVRPWMIDLDTGRETLVCDRHAGPVGWSEDARWIYLVMNEPAPHARWGEVGRVARVAAPSGEPEPMLTLTTRAAFSWVRMSAHGGHVLARESQVLNDLWFVGGLDLDLP